MWYLKMNKNWEEIRNIMTDPTELYDIDHALDLMKYGGYIDTLRNEMVFYYKSVVVKRRVQAIVIDLLTVNNWCKESGDLLLHHNSDTFDPLI